MAPRASSQDDTFTGASYTIKRPAKHSDPAEHMRRQTVFNAIVNVVQYLMDNQDQALMTLASLRQGQLKGSVEEPEEAKLFWDDSYSKLQKIPKYFLMENLRQMSGGELTIPMLTKADKRDADAIRDLHDFGTYTSGGMLLPRAALEKSVCREMFLRRHEQGGSLLRGFAKKAIAADGTIRWEIAGAYMFTFNEAGKAETLRRASGVTHTLTDEDGIFRRGSVSITDIAKHHSAEIRVGRSHLACWELFTKGDGPNRMFNEKGKELTALAEEIVAQRDAPDRGLPSGSASTQARVSAAQDSAYEAIGKLEKNVKERRAAAARKRKPQGEIASRKKVIKVT